jgi:hypothetical protein
MVLIAAWRKARTMTETTQAPAGTVRFDPAAPREQHLFQISPTLDENRALDLKPLYISLGLDRSAFKPEAGGAAAGAPSRYASPKAIFDTAIRGGRQYGDRIWFFKGDSYIRYFEKPDGNDSSDGPMPVTGNWPGWPNSFATGVDAALLGTGAYEGKIWFFSGSQYLRYDLATDQVDGQPRPIAGAWRGVEGPFAGRVDAAIHGMGAYYGVCWLFSGGQYLRYNLVTDSAEGGAQPIAGNWGGTTWPAAFGEGIDFAFYGTGPEAEKIYFFRGDQYIKYDLGADRVDEGPRPIVANWPNLTRFMPEPQLFIVERYALRSFHGEMGRGPMVEGQRIQVPPGGQTEFYLVTRRSETTTTSSSTNILESQSDQAVEKLSDAIRTDESNSGSQDKYDYHMDASFHGEASIGIGSGEADADLHVSGGSQDVRSAFANAVNKQLDRQASQTHDTHKQQVRTEATGTEINQETETGFKQTIDNRGNPNVLNCVIFQLTQEYIIVLSLIDAQLAFYNGNPRQSTMVSLRDMSTLLEQCVASPEARARIAATVVDTLQKIVDHSGQTRSLVIPVGGDPVHYQVDRSLTSTYEVKDTTGAVTRSIVVPGIVLTVDRPVVLTPNTAMAPLEIS